MLRSKVEFSWAGALGTPDDGSAHCTVFASSVSDGTGSHRHYRSIYRKNKNSVPDIQDAYGLLSFDVLAFVKSRCGVKCERIRTGCPSEFSNLSRLSAPRA
jgi:hypothetical protein